LYLVPGLVPVEQRLVADLILYRLQRVEQLGTGVEKALPGVRGQLKAQAQRALDGDAAVAEIGVVEHAAGFGVLWRAVFTGDIVNGCLIEITAFVAKTAFHRRPAFAGVNQLYLAFAMLRLVVGYDPDEGANASVVEHLLGQRDDGFELVMLDDPAADLAFAAASTSRKQRRAIEHDGRARAGLVAAAGF